MGPDLSCKTKTMKPQIILFTTVITLTAVLFSATANASGTTAKKEKTENNTFKVNAEQTLDAKSGQAAHPPKSNNPGKSRHGRDQHEKDSTSPKEASHRRAHGDEDGKHHHFHMHRAKKAKRLPALICLLAKILLFIVHICLLVYVINAPFAH
jgi:hypothetical protein